MLITISFVERDPENANDSFLAIIFLSTFYRWNILSGKIFSSFIFKDFLNNASP